MNDSPDGIVLHPAPPDPPKLSKRGLIIVGVLVLILIGALIYGFESRRSQHIAASAQEDLKLLHPAPATDVIKDVPPAVQSAPASQPPAAALPVQPAVEAQARASVYTPPATPPFPRFEERTVDTKPTPEQLAKEREREAMLAPLYAALRHSAQIAPPVTGMPGHVPPGYGPQPQAPEEQRDEYTQVNMQDRKRVFLAAARARASTNYLQQTRVPQVGAYEIKAGWEIPAVMEQELNSDLPGEIKALVSQNVYDTATGQFLLVPQGSRLIGKYNSDIAYGQDGVQAVWDRIIFPDGSSINLEGMQALDSRGNAGMRHKVDRHYKRTFGMAFLTSLFIAAFDLSQRRAYGSNYGYGYPSAQDTASAAIGREMSQTGAMITRKNISVQPTIKVPVGYRFTVRVNRDMLFEAPYAPSTPIDDEPKQKVQRASW